MVFSKKFISSSDESIENLLYYKDCQHKQKETTPAAVPLRGDPPPPPPSPRAVDCPFPKMCCSLSCGNDCGNGFLSPGRQMEPLQYVEHPIQPPQTARQIQPVQPQIQPKGRKKKLKQPMRIQLQPPIGGRRDFGFTKERIKSLISQDEDIRKILKDLVRVTMQKVDLVEMINSRNNMNVKGSAISHNSETDEDLE